MTSRRLSAVATLAVLSTASTLVAGCGGGGGVGDLVGGATTTTRKVAAAASSTSSGATVPTTAATETTETTEGGTATTGAPANAEDLALARSAALQLRDLPSGWTLDDEKVNTGDFGSSSDAEFEKSCPDVYDEVQSIISEGGQPSDVTRSFSTGDGMPSVDSSPTVFASEDFAKRAFDVIAGGKFAHCMKDVIPGVAGSSGGAGLSQPEIKVFEFDGRGLDDSGGFAVSMPVSAGGTSMVMQFAIAAMRSGRLVHVLALVSVDGMSPFPQRQDVVAAAVARTAAA